MSRIRERLVEQTDNDGLLFLDPGWQFDDAIVGVLEFNGDVRVLYDYDLVLEAMIRDCGSAEDAIDYIGFNIQGIAPNFGAPLLMTRRNDGGH